MDINSEEYKQEVLIKDVVMLAARILLESGAEGTRVEDTMTRIAKKLGYSESNSFVTNTVIQFTLHSESFPRIFRITSRDTNLIKISRQITNNEISLAEAKTQLEKIYVAKRDSSLPFKGFAAAMIAMSFLYLQGGRLIDVLTAILAGSLGYLVTEILDRKLHAQFIPEFIGSLVIGIIAVIGHTLIPTGDLATIIIAAVMPIVPGVLITNAIQDLFGGHMLMFTTKSLEALVTAFGIGAGVGSVLILV
ncbi:TPA: threonine/serine exporter ThrE family protein [Staphylococcus aureus]|uniref:threonine/serine exporter family protein n=1 Tax=Staphylococcus aureus TaxID=1280 RepID=UPI000ABB5CE7|nr:threonine/serine exporter ThrE family protein [Staphylococcus aureus]MCG5635430.1 threonine/serine exporter ThrE family protein [Staphylococcus aureus]WIZ86940.1 threonine/serine exporter ThrE family protein [Staphylococcus aureus]HBC4299041.1 threonine/serine exporter ThrE family protein [Staphylococcus aureus]HDK3419570.1 threonine/serine exporter ThrE family protein [Staphylococcus aureus]HDK3422330.1 threonine/serine exporter ThrE family protein [Staphylococcus aureus]